MLPNVSDISEQPAVMQGQAAELKSGISHAQACIAKAHERQHQLQSQRTQLKQRLSKSIASLDAILSISSLLPGTPAVPDPDQGSCCYVWNVLVMDIYMYARITANFGC